MTKLLFITLLFGLILHQSAAWEETFGDSFVVGQPKFSNIVVPVLGSPITLTLVSTNSSSVFVLCGQRYFQPTADFKNWNANTCQIYAVTNATTTVTTNSDNTPRVSRRNRQTFTSELEIARDLIPATYWVGVVVQNRNANANFTFSGQACDKGHFGWNCTVSTQFADLSRNETLDFTDVNNVKYLEFNIETGISVSSLELNLQAVGNSSYDIRFDFFNGTLPLSVHNTSNSILVNNRTVNIPLSVLSAGDYFVVLTPVPAKSYYRRRVYDQFRLSLLWQPVLHKCGSSRFGPLCQNATKVNTTQVSQIYTFNTNASAFNYFYVFSSQSNDTFNMTVQPTSGSGKAPQLYVRKGAVPTQLLFDGASTNSSVAHINLGLHDTGKWFFGILGTGSSYAVWFNSQCPNACSNNGNCVLSNGAYSCQCNDGYELFDCSQKKDSGFKTEYIVLIVIGSIIALAALVGLIVYLYNRGKHPGGGYERI